MANIAGDGHTKILNGTEEDDLIVGHRIAETLNGFGGNDHLIGGLGNDTLNGGDGNDILNGHADADDLFGGAGSDTFVFESAYYSLNQGGQRDLIADLEAQDFIDFSHESGITSLDQITIVEDPPGPADYRILVDIRGDGSLVMGIDVIGVQPTLEQFII